MCQVIQPCSVFAFTLLISHRWPFPMFEYVTQGQFPDVLCMCEWAHSRLMMWSVQPNVRQVHSYLVYEGGFGCGARWHVGLIQTESPEGETTAHMWSKSKTCAWNCSNLMEFTKKSYTGPFCYNSEERLLEKHILCILFPAPLGHQEQWLPFWEK